MQRTLIMVRHAKAVYASALESDFDRALSDRGKEDAVAMGKKLHQTALIPDLIIASPAKRTRQTAKRLAKELNYDPEDIVYLEKLYHCTPAVFEAVLRDAVAPTVGTLYIVAHNPGITEFVDRVSPKFRVDNMPTCGVAGIHFEGIEWGNYTTATDRNVFYFEFPRN